MVTPIGVGMPAWLVLNEFGMILRDDFQQVAYLVGSSLLGKGARDVDVRIILSDGDFMERFPSGPNGESMINVPGTRWASQCRAYSALGAQMTGLSIDFQVQMQSLADQYHNDQPRLGLLVLRNQR